MMKVIRNTGRYAAVLLLCSGLYACKKETDKTLQSSLAKSLAVYKYIPQHTDTVYVPHDVIGEAGTNTGFSAMLRKAVDGDVEVTAKIDTDVALIREFEKLFQLAPSSVLTQNLFKLSGSGSVTIKAGQTQSENLFKIRLDRPLGLEAGRHTFVVPLRLSSNRAGVELSSDIFFFRTVVTAIDVVNVDHRNSGLAGTQIDRTGWSITASSENTMDYGSDNGAAANALDRDNHTSWISSYGLPQWLQLDMGEINTVNGFSMVPNYVYDMFNGDILEMEVLSSNDGLVWKTEGTYKGNTTAASSSPGSPDVKTIKFIIPVSARYFKFNVTNSAYNSSVAGVAELYAIE